MKKIFTAFCFLMLLNVALAQKVDTLFYGDSKNVLENPFGWGFIAGTNEYGDIGKYQRFEFIGPDVEFKIFGAIIYLGYKRIAGTPDTIDVVFRKVGAKRGPGELLAKTRATLDKFDATGKGTKFTIPTPITVPIFDSLFIGIEWSLTANDTFALITDKDKEGELANRAWEKFTDGKVQEFNDPSDFSWHLDADIWIAALYGDPGATGVVANQTAAPLSFDLRQNYPNPFNPATTIEFHNARPQHLRLEILNLQGRVISSLVNGTVTTGVHRLNFDAANLSVGEYFYRLTGDDFVATRKLVLLK